MQCDKILNLTPLSLLDLEGNPSLLENRKRLEKTAGLEEGHVKRFAERVKPLPSGCWEWIGNANKRGYGIAIVKAKRIRAHRLMWEMVFGEIPDNMRVCHKCDNPPCVNPAHLFCDTQAANLADMRAKNRHCFGNAAPFGKLTSESVIEMRNRRTGGEPIKDLASAFQVSIAAVSMICNKHRWKHL